MCPYICFDANTAVYDLCPLRSTPSERLQLRGTKGVSDDVGTLRNPGTTYLKTGLHYNYKNLQCLSESPQL